MGQREGRPLPRRGLTRHEGCETDGDISSFRPLSADTARARGRASAKWRREIAERRCQNENTTAEVATPAPLTDNNKGLRKSGGCACCGERRGSGERERARSASSEDCGPREKQLSAVLLSLRREWVNTTFTLYVFHIANVARRRQRSRHSCTIAWNRWRAPRRARERSRTLESQCGPTVV